MTNKTGTIPPQNTGRAPATPSTPPSTVGTTPTPSSSPGPGFGPGSTGNLTATPSDSGGGPTQPMIVQGTPLGASPGMAAPGDVVAQLKSQVKADEAPLSAEQSRDRVEGHLTSGASPAKPGTIATAPRATNATHLLVRTAGRNSFRRGGMTFTTDPQVVKVEDIGEERARAIEVEPMLEVHRITEDEAQNYQENYSAENTAFSQMTDDQIRQELSAARRELTKANARIAEHEAKSADQDAKSMGDLAPRQGESFDSSAPRRR